MQFPLLQKALVISFVLLSASCNSITNISNLRNRILLQPRSDRDCTIIGYQGISIYDCPKKAGHLILADGSCPIEFDGDCKSYCEVRRTGFLTPVQIVPGAAVIPAGGDADLQKGLEISITNGFGISAAGTFKDVFSLGVDYQWSIAKTKTTSIQYHAQGNAHKSQWVYFGILIETCGTGSVRTVVGGCTGPYCGVTMPPHCEGTTKTFSNVCSRTPMYSGGELQLMYAQRYIDDSGAPFPLDAQPDVYKKICTEAIESGQGYVCGS